MLHLSFLQVSIFVYKLKTCYLGISSTHTFTMFIGSYFVVLVRPRVIKQITTNEDDSERKLLSSSGDGRHYLYYILLS